MIWKKLYVVKVLFTIVLVIVLFGCPNPDDPEYYLRYVSPSGKDSNRGTTEKPWATLSRAASGAQPGFTIFLREGTYNDSLLLSTSGTEGNPITFAAYPNERAVIDGTGVALEGDGRLVGGDALQYIRIIGLAITNSEASGVALLD